MEAVHTLIAARRDRSKSRRKQTRRRQPASASLSNVRALGPPSVATSCNTLKDEQDISLQAEVYRYREGV